MDTLSSKWATKPSLDGPSSTGLNLTSAPPSNAFTYLSAQGEEPVSGSSSGVSFIDHFNS